MDHEDFWLMLAGWSEELFFWQDLFGNHAYIVHCSMVAKPMSRQKLWPSGRVKEKKVEDISKQKALLKKFKEQEFLKKLHGTSN